MRLTRSRGAAVLLGIFLPATILLLGAGARSKSTPSSESRRAARGRYLVTVAACNDCHTPWKMGLQGVPELDMTRMLSGHPEGMKMPPAPAAAGPWIWFGAGTNTAFAGPWGITYSINLTPDQNTGLGIWTEDMFVKALKTGKHFGTSRLIQPPMPWPAYSQMTDADLRAIYAYLLTIPPIGNRVPDYQEPPAARSAPAKK